MTFVDAGIWAASVVVTESRHREARDLLAAHARDLMTTDLVVAETLTLLRARRAYAEAIEVGRMFFRNRRELVRRLTDEQWDAGWAVFHDFADKRWSFVDCTSYVMIQSLGIDTALSLDHHFRQFGNVRVLP